MQSYKDKSWRQRQNVINWEDNGTKVLSPKKKQRQFSLCQEELRFLSRQSPLQNNVQNHTIHIHKSIMHRREKEKTHEHNIIFYTNITTQYSCTLRVLPFPAMISLLVFSTRKIFFADIKVATLLFPKRSCVRMNNNFLLEY